MADGNAHHHLFVQAPIRALDEDGLSSAIIGTALFAVATVLCLLFADALARNDNSWWLWVSVAGTVLGACGIVYCRRRAASRAVS